MRCRQSISGADKTNVMDCLSERVLDGLEGFLTGEMEDRMIRDTDGRFEGLSIRYGDVLSIDSKTVSDFEKQLNFCFFISI
jgi:hypothetical protein